jgi:hypothetical protein
MSNYRGVAILSVFGELFELLVYRVRGGLGPKASATISFIKGHRAFAEKASHHFQSIASIRLKMYLNSLAILEKAEKAKKV